MAYPVTNTKQIKELILKDYVLTVGGYIRLQAASHVPQQIVDVVLFMYAKPNIINLKLENAVQCILFCPIVDINITWYSIQMKIRSLAIQSYDQSFVISLKSENQTVTVSNCVESSVLNEKEIFEVTMESKEADPVLYVENVGSLLFKDVANFMTTLPPVSKKHIWEHSVKSKVDGRKHVLEQTADENHITRLICDCVIVFIKYLDRHRAPLSTRRVRPFVTGVASYVYNKYHPLRRDAFENDKAYFAEMLTDYVENQLGVSRQVYTTAHAQKPLSDMEELHRVTATELGHFVLTNMNQRTLNQLWKYLDENESGHIERDEVLNILQWMSVLYVAYRFKKKGGTGRPHINKNKLKLQFVAIKEWILDTKMNSKRVVTKTEFREVFGNWLLQYDKQ